MRPLFCLALLLPSVSYGADYTINKDGINSKALGLTGGGVLIGQVETAGRAAKHGVDIPAATNSQVVPAFIYGPSTSDHGTQVAGVMIATGEGLGITEGVAPEAILHANYFTAGLSGDDAASIAMNQLATIDNMRAINLSWVKPLSELEPPDGNNHLAKFVDWSAAEHDVLYVAGNTEIGRPDFVTPQDNFNGMTIGGSQSFNADSNDLVYRQAWFGNTTIGDASGDERVTIDLLAPAWEIRVPSAGNTSPLLSGTSLAAPHVVGAAALLHQFADFRMNTEHAHRHEVIKSVF